MRFEDVRALDDGQLRTLLQRGRPEERVWALWALALRSSDIAMDHDEPDPGVRRHLVVVLAAHAKLDLLVELARTDPAEEVRAAAMQLVTRFAIEGRVAASVVTERAMRDHVAVRLAVLEAVVSRAPAWLVDLAERMLGDRDGDVRYEAFEALMRSDRIAAALMWLEEAPEAETRLALMRWLSRGQVRPCAEALAGSSRRLRRMFVDCVRSSTWDDIAPAIGADPELIRTLAGRNAQAARELPLVVLVRAALQDTSDMWIMLIRDRLAALEAPDEVATVLPAYRDLCARRIEDLDQKVAALREDKDVDQASMLEELRGAFARAHDHAARLMVH